MARVFNGSTQYLDYNSGAVVSAVPFTLCCWFRKSDLTSDTCLLQALKLSDKSYAGLFARSTASNGNKIQAILSYTGVSAVVINASTYTANDWHFAALRCDSTTSRSAWYNATKTSDTTSQSLPTLDAFTVARWNHTTPNLYFYGRLAYCAAWNVALSDDDLGDLGQKLNGVPCGVHPTMVRPDALITCWDLGGFAGDDDRDTWNSYDLTAYNSPTFDESPAVIYPDEVQVTGPGVSAGGGAVSKPVLFHSHFQNQGWR